MSELKPRTASVVIYQGDDIERLSELRRAAEIAQRQADGAAGVSLRVGDDLPTSEDVETKRAAYDEFVDEAAKRAIVVEVTALKRARFRELMAAHPARDKNEDDEQYGVNVDTFPPLFLAESATVAVGERELPAAKARDLLDELPEGDFDRVFATAYMLNRAPGADPRDGRYSSAPRTSDAI